MGPYPRLNGLRMLLIYQGTARCRLVRIWVRLSVVRHGFVLGGGQQETQKSRRHEILAFPNEGLSGCNSQVYCFDQSKLDSLEPPREIHQYYKLSRSTYSGILKYSYSYENLYRSI